ncbi:hypothetical protein KUCAC02_031496 [Chaenocephalus aceratus]|nr:hypothetical protein KUCAC02_031496 [Chaenocephalus aceratus]
MSPSAGVKTFCVSHSLERILCASCPPGHRELCGFPQFTSEISSCRPLVCGSQEKKEYKYQPDQRGGPLSHLLRPLHLRRLRPCSHKSCK